MTWIRYIPQLMGVSVFIARHAEGLVRIIQSWYIARPRELSRPGALTQRIAELQPRAELHRNSTAMQLGEKDLHVGQN